MDRYEEALAKARELHGTIAAGRDFLAEIFPELRESEDERIRKAIMEVLKRVSGATDVLENQGTTFKKAMIWLEKQKELPTNEEMLRTLRVEYEKGVADTIAKYEQKEQKPAEWSEEDEKMRKRAICACNYVIEKVMDDGHYQEARDWLESLPIGFIVNPHYNEDMVTLLIGELQQIAKDHNAPRQYDAEISWLKSLRPPQYCENCKLKRSFENWKPSEEQMYILNWVANILLNHDGIVEKEVAKKLQSLCNDLNKLM